MNFILLTIIGIIANVAQAQVEFPPSSGRSQIIERHIPTSAVTITSGLDQAYRVAWSPDSKYFAVIGAKGSGDGTTFSVVVYDADTQKMIQTLPVKKPGSLVGDIAFSPDGKYLAAGIGIITLWDAKNWQPVRDIAGPYIDIPSQRTFGSSGVHSIIFSPDSRVLTVLYDSVSYWPTSVTNKTKEAADSLQSLLASSKRDGTFWEKMNREELATGLSTIMAFDVETTKRLFTQPSSIPTPEKNSRFPAIWLIRQMVNICCPQESKFIN